MTDAEWLMMQNQNAIRSQDLSPELYAALEQVLPEMGLQGRVISGGQAGIGSDGPRTGSTRHDHGHAADLDLYSGDRKLDWNNPDDLPILQDFVARSRQAGLTGIGAGDDYMGSGRFHVGFGAPSVWGAGGKAANAPDWLREAYYGAEAGPSVDLGTGPTVERAQAGIPLDTRTPTADPRSDFFADEYADNWFGRMSEGVDKRRAGLGDMLGLDADAMEGIGGGLQGLGFYLMNEGI